jgi:hypothetical protein
MGYNYFYSGGVGLDKPLDEKTKKLIERLCLVNRVKRDVSKIDSDPKDYGVEGEFHLNLTNNTNCESTIDELDPPSSPPDTSSCWKYDAKGNFMYVDDNYNGSWEDVMQWLNYYITKIFKPRGYILDGKICYDGEERDDGGSIICQHNKVFEERRIEINLSQYNKLLTSYDKMKKEIIEVKKENEELKRKIKKVLDLAECDVQNKKRRIIE